MDFLLRIFAAGAAGLLSFLSPCVLPLVPSYLAVLTGSSLGTGEEKRMATFLRSVAFSLGFTAVFVALGLILSQASAMIGNTGRNWSTAAGILVIVLGLNVYFDFASFLNRERRFHPTGRPKGLFQAALFGAAFAAGWSPCVGPILASILLMAGSGSPASAALLLAFYSAGLALPFLAAGLFLGRLKPLLDALKRRMGTVKLLSALLLVAVGVSMILGSLRSLSSLLVRAGYALQEAETGYPGAFRIGATAIYGLASAAGLFFALRGRSPALRLAALVLALLSILEASALISTAHALSAWLLFQGL